MEVVRGEIMGVIKEGEARLAVERAKIGKIGNVVERIGKDIVQVKSKRR